MSDSSRGENVFETKSFGSFITPQDGQYNYRGITIPGRGIIIAEGALTGGDEDGMAMLQHEFGHILQFRKVGSRAYFGLIAPESFASSLRGDSHHSFWTETWANYLSNKYFGPRWIGGEDYPPININLYNRIRVNLARTGIIYYNPIVFL